MLLENKEMERKFEEAEKAMEEFGLYEEGVDTIFRRYFPDVVDQRGAWDHISDSYEQIYIIQNEEKFYKFGYTYDVCYWNEVKPTIKVVYI